ncbi:NHL repeat-containing protein [Mangrovibacterium diazotrophicum]|uniref:Sugar lactone lactonase YvrE n=1 Tax=Mangrovibacterium diazotrophicum TaxID=1261403 RepID=A0A419VWL7_9BACT|nr:ATP-binding protein [Mangrovibacterium diazotrophicum]RKD86543.1 hypothetical protein BC643_4241 [Mangrovibacterium diazotrophicum]
MKPKYLLVLLYFITISFQASSQKLVEVWRTGPTLKTPESALYDPASQIIYVANINGNPTDKDGNGFISLLNPDGTIKQLEWVTGLNGPKGMAIFDGKLYVSDIDQLVEIDIAHAKIVKRYPAPNAIFLNDVAACQNGMIFVSDNRAGRIHVLKDGNFSVWLEGDDFMQTNGLYTENGKLYAGSEVLKEIDIKTKTIKVIQTGCQGIDGLDKDELGNFVFSNWVGRIFYLEDGKLTKMWDSTAENLNTADVFYANELKLLFVPTFFDNQIIAYKIEH